MVSLGSLKHNLHSFFGPFNDLSHHSFYPKLVSRPECLEGSCNTCTISENDDIETNMMFSCPILQA